MPFKDFINMISFPSFFLLIVIVSSEGPVLSARPTSGYLMTDLHDSVARITIEVVLAVHGLVTFFVATRALTNCVAFFLCQRKSCTVF